MNRLAQKIREENSQPFGVTELSRSEFRKRALSDEAFRMTMARKMGTGNFLDIMSESNGETDGSPQAEAQNA